MDKSPIIQRPSIHAATLSMQHAYINQCSLTMSRDSAGQIQTRCLWSLLTCSARNIDRCLPLSIDCTPSSTEDMGSRPSKMFFAELDYSCAPVFPTEWTQSGPGPAFHNSGGKKVTISVVDWDFDQRHDPTLVEKLNRAHLCACEISLLPAIMFLRFCSFHSLYMLVSDPAVGGWLHWFFNQIIRAHSRKTEMDRLAIWTS